MSAHETVDGQAASSLDLALSMTAKPRTVRLGPVVFSVWFRFLLGLIRMDASQPCEMGANEISGCRICGCAHFSV